MRRDDARQYSRERLTRKVRPSIEGLEDRKLLYSTTGALWSQPERVTFSFVPDGTNIGGLSSSLYSTLNSQYANWQGVFQQAAAIWEQVANVNLVMVSDNGAALAVGSYQQGDPNNGDIRISGTALYSGALATTFLPPPLNGGPDAGDTIFNTNVNWTKGSGYDLLTVAVHEFGHALGMGHSTVSAAEMYAYYNATKSYLTTDDINGIQSIYSSRQQDAFTATYHNTSLANAADITSHIDANGQIALSNLDIVSSGTPNWFKVTVPSGTTGSAAITMQSTSLSELSPRVQLYNSSGTSIGYAYAANTYGATVIYTLTGISAGQTYYIKTGAANSGPTGAGGYGLELNFGTLSQAAITPPNTQVANQLDSGGGSLGDHLGWGPPGRTVYVADTVSVGTVSAYGDNLQVAPHRRLVHPHGPAAHAHHGGHVNVRPAHHPLID